MKLEWMAWTTPTAIFFTIIILMLLGMTLWQLASPTIERRGFLPLVTTRGDRLFIGLLSGAYIHLAWLGLTTYPLWWATVMMVVWMAIVMRWGQVTIDQCPQCRGTIYFGLCAKREAQNWLFGGQDVATTALPS